MSYENKILQMKKLLKKNNAQQETISEPMLKPDVPKYAEIWQNAGLQMLENDFGVVFLMEKHYPLDYKHGAIYLGELYDAFEKWQRTQNTHPIALTDANNLVFYDTETTGLKGVGTHIFLNGLLEESADGFTLKQYVLADPSNEVAFLFESKFWQGHKTIITYNGKSFDWPQLQTRWTLNKKDLPPLRDHDQLDLLHGSKRIWKNDIARMKLSQVEEEKLGFHRVDDVPGYLAPIIYFDAVKSGQPDALLKVLQHNEWDLLSLLTLYVQATNLLCENVAEESATTYTNIGKWYADLKEIDRSEELLQQVTSQYTSEEAANAYYHLGFQQKKQQNFKGARQSFQQALPFLQERQQITAFIELAKIFEHRDKNYNFAIEMTEQAWKLVKESSLWTKEHKISKLADLKKRKNRLERKK
ncbi:ribonuclease H-like domain-containing protein [Viridibacillus sp. YIM B01967]|uniref:Ribonuclease H-like domain-containing protein n=1 Tax=Viridibacillus soli TaxID=2798301 RepID=A0ABS1HCS5_9BACL|nr:ribonuclease H-like domain-containing protein [Viridibacillus soli]MBK3496773.1 ribonuclease H-like domain-containing protein [Viridibacillus soli]